MAGHMHIYRTAAPNWLSINEGDIVWATAGPGWQKWIWSPFLICIRIRGQQALFIMGNLKRKKYLQLLDKYELMSYAVRRLNID